MTLGRAMDYCGMIRHDTKRDYVIVRDMDADGSCDYKVVLRSEAVSKKLRIVELTAFPKL